jgi:hypothetical protein
MTAAKGDSEVSAITARENDASSSTRPDLVLGFPTQAAHRDGIVHDAGTRSIA